MTARNRPGLDNWPAAGTSPPTSATKSGTSGGTVEEILQHADELAARFESYVPNPEDELDVGAVGQLRAAVTERSEAERHLIEAIRGARQAGMP